MDYLTKRLSPDYALQIKKTRSVLNLLISTPLVIGAAVLTAIGYWSVISGTIQVPWLKGIINWLGPGGISLVGAVFLLVALGISGGLLFRPRTRRELVAIGLEQVKEVIKKSLVNVAGSIQYLYTHPKACNSYQVPGLFMLSNILIGISYALSAGLQPGPLQAFFLAKVAENGWRRALPAAFAPSDQRWPDRLDFHHCSLILLPESFRNWIQLAGGVLLLYFAWSPSESGIRRGEQLDEFGEALDPRR